MKVKKIAAVFLAVVMIMTVASVPALASGSVTTNYGYYSLTTYDSTVTYRIIDRSSVPENVVVPDGVTTIGKGAFGGIPQLKSVTVPTSVTSFESGAFGSLVAYNTWGTNDSWLAIPTDIYYKGTEIQWNSITNRDKVIPCINIHYEGGTGDNTSLLTIENGVLTKCEKVAGSEVIVPSGVTAIGDSAFSRCQYITSVILPEGVTWLSMTAGN